MVFRHHTVLAQISLSYSVPKGRFPRVTHPCATKLQAEALVSFDLHVLSMPPAFVLSQDQTLKFDSKTKLARINPLTNRARTFRRCSCTIFYTWLYRTYALNDYFFTKHPGPKNPRTWRRRPHVPSSFYHNVKEPSQFYPAYTDKKSGHL